MGIVRTLLGAALGIGVVASCADFASSASEADGDAGPSGPDASDASDAATPLPRDEAGTAAVTTRYLVAVGGLEPTDGGSARVTRTTAYATIRANGTISDDWTRGPDLPRDVTRFGLFATRGAFHVAGGYGVEGTGGTSELETSTSDTGAFAPFVRSYLAGAISDSAPVIARGRAYALPPGQRVVYSAAVASDGRLGGWTQQTGLDPGDAGNPYGIAAATPDHLFLLGQTKRFLVSPLLPDDKLGPWRALPTLPLYIWKNAGAVVSHERFLYLVGGYTTEVPTGLPVSDVYVAEVDGNGAVSPWKATEPYPQRRYDAAVVGGGGFLYVLAGQNAGAIDTISFAKILPDGMLGRWETAGTLPTAFRSAGYVIVER